MCRLIKSVFSVELLTVLVFYAGGDTSRLYVLSVMPHGSAISGQSQGRHVLPVVHFFAIFLLHGLAEGTMVAVQLFILILLCYTLASCKGITLNKFQLSCHARTDIIPGNFHSG